MNEMPVWFTTLSNFGFPAIVTAYLLIRFEKIIKDLTTEVKYLLDEVKKRV